MRISSSRRGRLCGGGARAGPAACATPRSPTGSTARGAPARRAQPQPLPPGRLALVHRVAVERRGRLGAVHQPQRSRSRARGSASPRYLQVRQRGVPRVQDVEARPLAAGVGDVLARRRQVRARLPLQRPVGRDARVIADADRLRKARQEPLQRRRPRRCRCPGSPRRIGRPSRAPGGRSTARLSSMSATGSPTSDQRRPGREPSEVEAHGAAARSRAQPRPSSAIDAAMAPTPSAKYGAK